MNSYLMKSRSTNYISKISCLIQSSGLTGILILCALLFVSFNALAADSGSSKRARTLDTKVQDLKREVKSLNRDLFILEEELLFPSSTQLAVFVSLDVGNFFRLDSIQLKIDNKIVSNHLYTKRELEALSRGGVQRLYLGNVKSGEHELIAIFSGPGPNNREYRRGTTLKFNKTSSAKYMELKIVDSSGKLQPEFAVKEWE
jgi:hypothetical protein